VEELDRVDGVNPATTAKAKNHPFGLISWKAAPRCSENGSGVLTRSTATPPASRKAR